MTFEELQQELNEQTRRHAREIELHQKTRARAERAEARVKELESDLERAMDCVSENEQENLRLHAAKCPACITAERDNLQARVKELEAVAQADHHIREDERAGIMRIANERAKELENESAGGLGGCRT